jgi:hypothetical protein
MYLTMFGSEELTCRNEDATRRGNLTSHVRDSDQHPRFCMRTPMYEAGRGGYDGIESAPGRYIVLLEHIDGSS